MIKKGALVDKTRNWADIPSWWGGALAPSRTMGAVAASSFETRPTGPRQRVPRTRARWQAPRGPMINSDAAPQSLTGNAASKTRPLRPSFRGDAKQRTTMCNCTSENLEIPGLVLRTIPEW